MANELHSYGCFLQVTISATPTTIGKLTGFSIAITRDMAEATSLDSTGMAREFIPGWISFTATATVRYLPASSGGQDYLITNLLTNLTNGTLAAEAFTVLWSDSGTTTNWTFSGHVAGFTPTVEFEQVIGGTFEIQGTGLPTYP